MFWVLIPRLIVDMLLKKQFASGPAPFVIGAPLQLCDRIHLVLRGLDGDAIAHTVLGVQVQPEVGRSLSA